MAFGTPRLYRFGLLAHPKRTAALEDILIFGMTLLTLVHVVLSLVGISWGIVVAYGFLTSKRLEGWTTLFLVTTVLTSVTGFFFPFHKFLPSHALGIISLVAVALAVALVALYARELCGAWRLLYVVSAVLALYLNVFVLVVQLFQKVPALKAVAPTQSEPPFAATPLVVLILFIALGFFAGKKFRMETARTA